MTEQDDQFKAPPVSGVPGLAEHLFRHEAGKLVSVLTGVFGIGNLQLAEDVVQEALARALQTWPYYGVPRNPAAWLTQKAKNLALDRLRREKNFADKLPGITVVVEQWGRPVASEEATFDEEFEDAHLRMMFACCHPELAPEAQTALALKTLCGFSPQEIAKAFLTSEAAIAKRLTRAKQRIRDLGIPFAIPTGEECGPRLDGVLHTLYLLFNEGYKASSGDQLTRGELCMEAIRLATILAGHPVGNQPAVHAMLALMLFNAARLRGRVDDGGNLLRLFEQDRSRWDRAMISRGLAHMARSAGGEAISVYHLEAGIAACHAIAPDHASTDWNQILHLYDRLVEMDASPIVALNRAVAVAHVKGPAAGIAAVKSIPGRSLLKEYHLLPAVLAEFEMRQENFAAATEYLEEALALTAVRSEQEHLRKQLRECRAARPSNLTSSRTKKTKPAGKNSDGSREGLGWGIRN